MSTNDTVLLAQVRGLTDYDENIISDYDLQEVLGIAKTEIRASIGDENLDFSSSLQADRALFWLTCIFCKVKAGEIDSPSFNIGELSVRQSNVSERHNVWIDNFWKHYRSIDGGSPVAHTKASRPDRDYDYDNSATSNSL